MKKIFAKFALRKRTTNKEEEKDSNQAIETPSLELLIILNSDVMKRLFSFAIEESSSIGAFAVLNPDVMKHLLSFFDLLNMLTLRRTNKAFHNLLALNPFIDRIKNTSQFMTQYIAYRVTSPDQAFLENHPIFDPNQDDRQFKLRPKKLYWIENVVKGKKTAGIKYTLSLYSKQEEYKNVFLCEGFEITITKEAKITCHPPLPNGEDRPFDTFDTFDTFTEYLENNYCPLSCYDPKALETMQINFVKSLNTIKNRSEIPMTSIKLFSYPKVPLLAFHTKDPYQWAQEDALNSTQSPTESEELIQFIKNKCNGLLVKDLLRAPIIDTLYGSIYVRTYLLMIRSEEDFKDFLTALERKYCQNKNRTGSLFRSQRQQRNNQEPSTTKTLSLNGNL